LVQFDWQWREGGGGGLKYFRKARDWKRENLTEERDEEEEDGTEKIKRSSGEELTA
jgi:hypothetical protein